MKKLLYHLARLLLLGALMFVFTLACNRIISYSLTSSKPLTENCRVVKHVMGETCIPLNPQRIVTLYSNLGNTLALGIKPIATTYTANEPLPEYLRDKMDGIELLGDTSQPNLEKILLLKPDLIISSSELEKIHKQLSFIAPTIAMNHSPAPSWKVQLEELAKMLNKEKDSKQLMDEYWQRIEKLKRALGDHRHQMQVSVASVSPNHEIYVIRGSHPSGIVLNDIGLQRPIVERGDFSYPINISEERLPEIDGDALFILSWRKKGAQEALEKLRQKPLWRQLKAVQQNQVYFVDGLHWHWDNILSINAIVDDLFKYLVDTP